MVAGAELGLAVQAGKGVIAPAATHRVELAGGSTPQPVKVAQAEASLTITRVVRDPFVEAVRVEGTPAVHVRPNVIGLLLFAALGAEAVSGSSDPWTHTITLGTSPPWLTLWRSVDAFLHERFGDCRLASLEITSTAGRPIVATFSVLGLSADHRSAGQTAGAIETANLLLHAHATGALLVEGVAASAISEWRLRVDTGSHYADSLAGPHIRPGAKVGIALTTRQVIVDRALWNRVHYGSASPAENAPATLAPLEITNIQFTITAATGPERSLHISIARPIVEGLGGYQPGVGGSPIEQVVTYRAYRPSAGSPITAIVKNGLSTTYAAQTAPVPVVHLGAVFLSGTAIVAVAGTVRRGGATTLVGTAAITAVATGMTVQSGAVSVSGTATLVATGTVTTTPLPPGSSGMLGDDELGDFVLGGV